MRNNLAESSDAREYATLYLDGMPDILPGSPRRKKIGTFTCVEYVRKIACIRRFAAWAGAVCLRCSGGEWACATSSLCKFCAKGRVCLRSDAWVGGMGAFMGCPWGLISSARMEG